MTIRVEFTLAAQQQVVEAASWWRTHRDQPEVFEEDLAEALSLLEREPPLAQVVGLIENKPVRKVRMPRTGHALYFVIEGDIVTIHAVWHGARGSQPPLGR